MAMVPFGKLAVCCRPAPSIARALSFFSSVALPAAVLKTPPIPSGDNYTRFLPPTTMVPPHLPLTPAPSHRRINDNSIDAEGKNLVMALQNLKRNEEAEINKLQWTMDSLRIARFLPLSKNTSSSVGLVRPDDIVPTYLPRQQQSQQPQEQKPQHRTFQVMNRNARKAKRANHGKRPCSRIRRRYKVKAWANTSRKG